MEVVNLPLEKAVEPNEEAHLPPNIKNSKSHDIMSAKPIKPRKKKTITFDSSQSTMPDSQSSSSNYKDALSQPSNTMTHIQKLLWLQKRRQPGLWAQCDDCDKWRYLCDTIDSYELPKKWYCRMNPDRKMASCSVNEVPLRIRDEEDLIHSEYSAGSLVWARLPGWPWWPAMVDDCPDTEQYYWLDGFSDIPTHYNVVFFDTSEVTRSWVATAQLKPYASNKHLFNYQLKIKKFKNRLGAAVEQANKADDMNLINRLSSYSFVSRFKGSISTPKKVKLNDLKKYQKVLKRKFGVEFPIEEYSDEEEVMPNKISSSIKRNKIGAGKKKTDTLTNIPIMDREAESENVIDSLAVNVTDNQETIKQSDDSTNRTKNNEICTGLGSESQTGLDNDSSNTYNPETSLKFLNASENSQLDTQDFQIRISTPNSDDFDF